MRNAAGWERDETATGMNHTGLAYQLLFSFSSSVLVVFVIKTQVSLASPAAIWELVLMWLGVIKDGTRHVSLLTTTGTGNE